MQRLSPHLCSSACGVTDMPFPGFLGSSQQPQITWKSKCPNKTRQPPNPDPKTCTAKALHRFLPLTSHTQQLVPSAEYHGTSFAEQAPASTSHDLLAPSGQFQGDRKEPAPTTLLLHPQYQTRVRSCSLAPSPKAGAHQSHLHPLACPSKSCSKTRAPQTFHALKDTPALASGLPWAESASLPSQGGVPSTFSLNGSSLMLSSRASFGQQLPQRRVQRWWAVTPPFRHADRLLGTGDSPRCWLGWGVGFARSVCDKETPPATQKWERLEKLPGNDCGTQSVSIRAVKAWRRISCPPPGMHDRF